MDQHQKPQSEYVFRGRIVSLRIDKTPSADGGTRTREIVEHAPGVGVVAVDDQARVLLVRQFRPALGELLLEIPAGITEPGEDPAVCAARELEEETGTRADCLEPLARFYPSPGFCTEELHVYLATGLRSGEPHPDDGEDIEVVWLTAARVRQMLARGEMRDGKTLVGLQAYLLRVDGAIT